MGDLWDFVSAGWPILALAVLMFLRFALAMYRIRRDGERLAAELRRLDIEVIRLATELETRNRIVGEIRHAAVRVADHVIGGGTGNAEEEGAER